MTPAMNAELLARLNGANALLPPDLQPVPAPPGFWQQFGLDGLVRVWRSRDFMVYEFEIAPPVLVRLSVHRTTWIVGGGHVADGIGWDELQRIKAACGYADADAVEVYPAAADVVNDANIRHLWVLRSPLPFAWRAAPGTRRHDEPPGAAIGAQLDAGPAGDQR